MLNNIVAKRLMKAVEDGQMTMLNSDFEVFTVDDGADTIAIITRDTEDGEIIYYGVYVCKVIGKEHFASKSMHDALDMAKGE
jgi:hypothetical protein